MLIALLISGFRVRVPGGVLPKPIVPELAAFKRSAKGVAETVSLRKSHLRVSRTAPDRDSPSVGFGHIGSEEWGFEDFGAWADYGSVSARFRL